jgi:acetylornithine deacetylase/succinyl-diaminopimelate desuccinylase-like protein
VDDKGQMMMFLEALRAWKEAAGGIPAQITALIEGEEEVGSPSLEPFLVANKPQLTADLALISDTLMWDINTPAITTPLGGQTQAQVTLKGANRDLHPGLYGGSALNAIEALARLLADLHDADGRVQLPSFYDKVRLISNAQRAQWDSLAFDESFFLGKVGLRTVTGEHGYPALERMWARPSADINGMWGGYTGPGSKTVIASEASAKISFRLVPDQDPDEVFEQFRQFVADRLPPDAKIEIAGRTGTPAIEVNLNSPWVRAAQTILGEEYGKPAVLKGTGGSIPAVVLLRNVLGIDSLLMGFALDEDGAHSPNEKFEQRCFHHGIRSHVRLVAKFAGG